LRRLPLPWPLQLTRLQSAVRTLRASVRGPSPLYDLISRLGGKSQKS
jgi:hypothetical protein